MKKHQLPTDDDILKVFDNVNFGEGSATEDARIKTVCEALLKVASGYSCGATLRDILLDLKMIRYNVRLGSVLTAYGKSCILAARKRLSLSGSTTPCGQPLNELLAGFDNFKTLSLD